MRTRKWFYPLLGLLLLLIVGCSPKGPPPPQPVLAARDRYAESIDVPIAEVQVVEHEQVTWDNSCMEMGPVAGNPCRDEETPGWRIIMEVNNQQKEVRANGSGMIVRWEGQPVRPVDVNLTPGVTPQITLDPLAGVTVEQELMLYESGVDLFEASPEHVRVRLNGYPLQDTQFEPHMRIYQVSKMEAVRGNVEQLILEHRQVLAALPDVERGSLPFVPMIQASQVFYAKPKLLSFQGGEGYRFLTEYGGEDIPITDENLFYAYQGLTEDDNYWVTAFLPVAAVEDARGSVKALNEAPTSAFTPNLDELDAMIQSIAIEQ